MSNPEKLCVFFFFNDTATTEIYTLSLHDALPIFAITPRIVAEGTPAARTECPRRRSEEHTSELQSRRDLVCRLLLEKKKTHAQAYHKSVLYVLVHRLLWRTSSAR